MPYRSSASSPVLKRGLFVWLFILLLGPTGLRLPLLMAQMPDTGERSAAPGRLPSSPSGVQPNEAEGSNAGVDENRPSNREEGVPDFHIAQMLLDGEVVGNRAFVTAQIDVDVNRRGVKDAETYFHDVALRLTQAHIISKTYEGPGQEGPVLDRPVEEGIVWRFSGHGTHHLTLKMWVAIRQSPAGSQLVLSLPTMPPGFDAQLNLSIPGPAVVIRASRDLSVLTNEHLNDQNQLTADVRGTRLDLTWSEPPEVQTAFVQSSSSITLRRAGDRVEAAVEQVLIPENAGVQEVEIKLPEGYEIEDLTGPMVRGHEPISGRNGWRRVKFRENSGEPIDLNWVLSATFAAGGGTLQFDGLIVPDARSQVGRIVINEFPGYQLVPRPGQFVRRVPATTPQMAEAFEFTKQPFKLAWDVQRITPKFSVRPRHVVFVGDSRLTLDSRFRVQTDAGSLDQATIEWETGSAEGWKIVPASGLDGVSITTANDPASQTGQVLVEWKAPRTGAFDFDVKFERSLNSDVPSTRIGLPQIRGARTQPVELVLAGDDHLDVAATPTSGEALSPLSGDPRRLEGIPTTMVSQVQRAFQLDPAQRQVELSWKTQQRVIDAEAEVEIRRESEGRMRIQQTIRFETKFGRLTTLRFQLPPALAALVPAGSEGAAFQITIGGVPGTSRIREGVLEAQLPSPQLGEVLATIEYSLPTATDRTSQTLVHILPSVDAKYRVTRLRIPEGEPFRVPQTTTGWQPVPTAPNATVWVSTTESEVSIQRDAEKSSSPRFRVDLAFYRTRYDVSGRVEGVCELHWEGDVRGMPISLPPDCELLGAMFNGTRLDQAAGQISIDPSQPSQYLFRFPPARDKSQLAFAFRTTSGVPFSNRDLREAPLPQLPQDVTVVRSFWELELPAGRHLLMGPRNLTPEHAWRRQGVFWKRTPFPEYVGERTELTQQAQQLDRLPAVQECYVFSSIGPMSPPRFQSMSRTMILLLGAGVTLALGFLFWSVPSTRNMLALLLLCFGISLLSLWYLEPIQLLMQPAVLGAGLAILASWIDLRSRRGMSPVSMGMVLPKSVPTMGPVSHDRQTMQRGSSVSSPRTDVVLPTAIYQPGSSEVGRP